MMMTTTMITVLLGAVRLDGAREQKTMTMMTDPHRDDDPLDVITMKMTTIAMIQRHEGDRYVVVAANPPPGPRLILIKDIAEAQGIRHYNSLSRENSMSRENVIKVSKANFYCG